MDNLHVSQGWFDSSVSLGEPGYEERETIVNGLSVAAKVALRLLLCNPTPSLLTIKHKLTLFRIRRVECYLFPNGFDKRK
jgi:dihydroorotase-like cyclic amidohydrolase